MIATFVHVWLIPGRADEFIEACRANHIESVKEPGNLRFDILRDTEDPDKFTLYEAYVSEEASNAHKDTAHYLDWKNRVADWMAKPRQGIKHHIICPEDPAKW